MFQALGNAKEQQAVRDANPERHHCFLLNLSPNACVALPQSFGEVLEGSICPNNPFNKAEALERSELFDRLLQFTVEAHRHRSVGGLNAEAPRVEVVLAYAYQRYLEERQWPKS